MNTLTGDSVSVMIEEETSNDDEIDHVNETLGYLAFEAPAVTRLELTKHCDSGEGPVCEGSWSCSDIAYITAEIMVSMDSNGDG